MMFDIDSLVKTQLNVKNINKLINHLKKVPQENFDMRFWLYFPSEVNHREAADLLAQMESTGGCGTTACIAGHAALLAGAEKGESVEGVKAGHVIQTAEEWLGLSPAQSINLFYECDRTILPHEVIPVLKKLRNTGEVDWHLAYENRAPHNNPYYWSEHRDEK